MDTSRPLPGSYTWNLLNCSCPHAASHTLPTHRLCSFFQLPDLVFTGILQPPQCRCLTLGTLWGYIYTYTYTNTDAYAYTYTYTCPYTYTYTSVIISDHISFLLAFSHGSSHHFRVAAAWSASAHCLGQPEKNCPFHWALLGKPWEN